MYIIVRDDAQQSNPTFNIPNDYFLHFHKLTVVNIVYRMTTTELHSTRVITD